MAENEKIASEEVALDSTPASKNLTEDRPKKEEETPPPKSVESNNSTTSDDIPSNGDEKQLEEENISVSSPEEEKIPQETNENEKTAKEETNDEVDHEEKTEENENEQTKNDTSNEEAEKGEQSKFPQPTVGVDSKQGRRPTMEDTHKVINNIKKEFPDLSLQHERCCYFGVYDGHGGTEVALMCEKILHEKIIRHPAFIQDNVEEAIENGFQAADEELLEAAKNGSWMSGTTVVISIILDNVLYVANAGDSEAILARRNGNTLEPVVLSKKHKPGETSEKERIKKAGGHVVFNRVMGSLAVARALGDKDFKYPYNKGEDDFVSGKPYINKIEIQPDDEFLIISCDGLWDRLSYQQAVDVTSQCRDTGKTAEEAAHVLVKNSIERGTLDNVTAIIVYLKPPSVRRLSVGEEENNQEKMDVWQFLKMMQEEKNKSKENSAKINPKMFGLPEEEKILEEHFCGIGKQVLTHGGLIITENYLCFHSSHLLSRTKTIKISIKDIQEIQKQKTLFIAHAIKISMASGKKYIFNWKQNAAGRDCAFSRLMDLVKNAPVEEKEVSSDSSSEIVLDDDEDGSNLQIGSWSRFDD